MPAICVIGSINMDVVVQGTSFPREGESLLVDGPAFHPGGKGANAAVAARRSQADVSLVGAVGDDPFGRDLTSRLAAEGIDTSAIRTVADAATGTAVILVSPETGSNSIMVAAGANLSITVEQVSAARERIAAADALLLSLETPLDVVRAAGRIAREVGTLAVLDAGPVRGAPRDIVAGMDIVSPNETEAHALTGICVKDLNSAREAAYNLLDAGAGQVVLKLGAMGCLFANGQNDECVPAFPVAAVDTTGAGDAFTGALAVACALALDVPESLRYANAAGALACATPGAQPSMPTRDAIEQLLKENTC